MWEAKEPRVYPEISTHFYPCTGGLFGKQSDKWVNVIDGYEDVDIENKFGIIYIEDSNENSVSFIGADNRHFHGGAYPLQKKVYQCGNEVDPALPYPVVGVGFQRDELIVACLISNNNIGFFKLETNDKNIDEWGKVGEIYSEEYLFLNHIYFSNDGTKAVTIASKKIEVEYPSFFSFKKEAVYIPYLVDVNISYNGNTNFIVNNILTNTNYSYLAPYTYKLIITAPIAAEYIGNEMKYFNIEFDFIYGQYWGENGVYLPSIEGIPYWDADYYYAYFNCRTGEHWAVNNLYWWHYGFPQCPGLTITRYQTTARNEIHAWGDFRSYNYNFNGFSLDKAIYTTQGLSVISSLEYSTLGNPGYPDAPLYGPLGKVVLKAIVPKIPDYFDGLFAGKRLGLTYFLLRQSTIYSRYDTGYSDSRYNYDISDYNSEFFSYQSEGGYVGNSISIPAMGSLGNEVNDTFTPRNESIPPSTSIRNVLLLIDLSQDLFVFGGVRGIKIIKNNQVIKEYNDSFSVGRSDMFSGNQFDGENDGLWGNIGVKYSSKNQDYLLQIGNNNAIFNGNDIGFKFEQIGVS